MNEKVTFWVFVILLIGLLVIQQILIQSSPSKERTILETVAEMSIKIDSLYVTRDSIIKEVRNTNNKLTEIEKDYETIRDSIITQSVGADCEFFSNYVSSHNRRLSGNNNR